MKVLYCLPHPSDRLEVERAGHIIRANALIRALGNEGHSVDRIQAAQSVGGSKLTVSAYRRLLRVCAPKPLALPLRDIGRIRFGRRFARRLIERVDLTKPDVILETHVGFSLASALATEETGVPLIIDDIAPALEEATEFGDGIGLKRVAQQVFTRVVDKASLIIAVSDHVRHHLDDIGVSPEKVALIPNGFDHDTFHPDVNGLQRRTELGLKDGDGRVLIGFVGSFLRFHRLELLIEAFAKIEGDPQPELFLVGDGPEAPALRTRAGELGVSDRVHFVGRVPHQDVPSYLAAADITVLPGALDFGHSMKLLEYMAMGKPTVAPDLAVISKIAKHFQHVILFNDGSIDDMSAALSKLISDHALRQRLRTESIRLASGHTWAARARDLTRILIDRRIIGQD